MANVYDNQLARLLDGSQSFKGTPGFKFALDAGMGNIGRTMAARGMRNSGNALTEMVKFGTGLATQDFGAHVDRLGRLAGQQGQLDLGRDRLTTDAALGFENLGNQRRGQDMNFTLDSERNALAASDSQNRFNLGRRAQDIDWFGAQTQRGNAMSNDARWQTERQDRLDLRKPTDPWGNRWGMGS